MLNSAVAELCGKWKVTLISSILIIGTGEVIATLVSRGDRVLIFPENVGLPYDAEELFLR